jgi:hypothetical protein
MRSSKRRGRRGQGEQDQHEQSKPFGPSWRPHRPPSGQAVSSGSDGEQLILSRLRLKVNAAFPRISRYLTGSDSRPGSGPAARLDNDVAAAVQQLRPRGADRVVRLLIVRPGHGSAMLSFPDDGPMLLSALRRFVADQTRR